jgi:putative ABC transport system permease protein
LVVTQFAISIVLLASTFVVYQQLRYLQQKDLGFEKEQVVMIPIRGTAVKENVAAFKDEIKRNSGVLSATALSDVVGREVTVRGVVRQGSEDQIGVAGLFADEDLAETIGLSIAKGRNLDAAFETDKQAALVNEQFAKNVEWGDEALGKWVWFAVENSPDRPVVGIVEDFNFAPLRQTVQPLVIGYDPAWFAYLAVRLAPGDARPTLEAIGRTWNQFEPARPFEPFFLDENLDALYATEARLGQTYGAFALLAIIIACLGLFGLAAYTAQQRTREIGVRKALGASIPSILLLLSRDFVILVGIAFVLAVPAAYLLLNRWLQGFAYHIDMGALPFIVAGVLALVIALLTISYQAIRAATVNPVRALRVE